MRNYACGEITQCLACTLRAGAKPRRIPSADRRSGGKLYPARPPNAAQLPAPGGAPV